MEGDPGPALAASASRTGARRPTTRTTAPRSPRASAMAVPMSPLAPVIRAVKPSKGLAARHVAGVTSGAAGSDAGADTAPEGADIAYLVSIHQCLRKARQVGASQV